MYFSCERRQLSATPIWIFVAELTSLGRLLCVFCVGKDVKDVQGYRMAILTVCLVAAASWSRPALVVSHATPHLTSHSRSIRACAVPMPAMPISEPADVPQPANDVPPEPEPLQDALAGITVGFSLLSKAIAASAIAGVDPLVGLWSSVVMGVTAPILGSRPGVISGAAAVVVVPLGVMVAQHGTAYIPLTILACAIFEGLFGFFRLARLTSIISDAVLSGFLNGLGLLLFMSQVKVFKYAPAFIPAVGVAAICAAVTELLPRVTTAVPSSLGGRLRLERLPSPRLAALSRAGRDRVPPFRTMHARSTLAVLAAGLAAATAVGLLSHQPLTTLASTADPSTFAGGLSSLPKLVDFGELGHLATSVPALKIVLPVALSIAFISLLETLLAAKVGYQRRLAPRSLHPSAATPACR